eukprot:Awhi_evm1s14063
MHQQLLARVSHALLRQKVNSSFRGFRSLAVSITHGKSIDAPSSALCGVPRRSLPFTLIATAPGVHSCRRNFGVSSSWKKDDESGSGIIET